MIIFNVRPIVPSIMRFVAAVALLSFSSVGIGSSSQLRSAGVVDSKSDNEAVIFNFPISAYDGFQPYAGLVGDGRGNFYGTTYDGGGQGCPSIAFDGCGTVFELSKGSSGYAVSFLYRFRGGKDGAHPLGTLYRAADGTLFGTTSEGGSRRNGTVFKLKPEGSGYQETVLYRFLGGKDGAHPYGGLVATGDGALLGTTRNGGVHNYGTIFSLTPSASGYTKSTIHQFTAYDGYYPEATLRAGDDGAYYGTTFGGWGNVFRLEPSGGSYNLTVLYTFRNHPDGANPYGGVVIGPNGTIYGTTKFGGKHNLGTVFKLKPDGSRYDESVILQFYGGNGATPASGLVLERGLLFGTTQTGGAFNHGLVFRLRVVDGVYAQDVLHTFSGQPDGDEPMSEPMIEGGTLLGTTSQGGLFEGGTIYSVTL